MVLGVAAIVLTAGAATPLVAVAWTAGASAGAYGLSNVFEGSQIMVTGADKAFNPLRDTLFQGNQSAYDTFGNVAVFAAGSVIPVGAALKAGQPVFRAVIGGVGRTSVTTAVGVGTNFVVAPIATSLAKSAGIDPIWAKDIGIGTGFAASIFTGRESYKAGGAVAEVEENGNAVNNNLKVITDIINKNGLTIDKFNELRLTNPSELSSEEVKTMQAIRDEIPKIGPNTFIQKTIPEGDIEGYLSKGWNKIGGYVAKYGDVSHIKNYDDVVESSRLDYVNDDGKRPYPEGGNTYGYIKFTTSQTNRISIPYGEVFGGTNTDGAPCMLNGFTGARNGEIIPEWMLNNRLTPDEGSELHKVVDGSDKIIGIFDGTKFVPIN